MFIGAGIETVPGIRRALDMGLQVVASDADPDAPGLQIADHRLIVSTYDISATIAAARYFLKKYGRH